MGTDPLVVAWAGLLGAALGSFLNVCILRWGAEPKQSVVRPPSRCPRCGRGLRWHDNIPIVAWLVLRGRCGKTKRYEQRQSKRPGACWRTNTSR